MKPQHAPILFFVVAFAAIVLALLFARPREESDPVWRVDLNPKSERRVPDDWARELNLAAFREKDGVYWQVTPSGVAVQATLDPALQFFLDQEFAKQELPYAAAVVVHLPDGEVRALSGRSQADPRLTPGELALTPWAPAASLFKLVSALALLGTPGFDPQETVCFSGGASGLTARHLEEPPPDAKTACENLETALANSSNAVLGKLAVRHLTPRRLMEAAAACGFNRTLPFEFAVGKSVFHLPQDADALTLAKAAAGFGHTAISPFHAAWLSAHIAMDGDPVFLHVLKNARDPDGREISIPRPRWDTTERFPEGIRQLRQMLAATVETGTAREAFFRGDKRLVPVPVGGKTGTLSRKDPDLMYTWFAGYFPVNGPRWAFAVLVVSPEKWRTKASYISARLVNRLLELEEKHTTSQTGDERHGRFVSISLDCCGP